MDIETAKSLQPSTMIAPLAHILFCLFIETTIAKIERIGIKYALLTWQGVRKSEKVE